MFLFGCLDVLVYQAAGFNVIFEIFMTFMTKNALGY